VIAKNKLRNPLPVSELTSGGGVLPPVEACILELVCTFPSVGADAVSRLGQTCGRILMGLSQVEGYHRPEARDLHCTIIPRRSVRGGQRRDRKMGGWIHGVAKQG
jgi:hypothetical protein